ncbi:hypothetical protein CBS101457_002782 [Exobasidium rhododendri]|nr:hypothetical protein CBS101457_002782 [Exobasidium rhododendri]
MASFPSFPYEAIASKRYKSPHKNDLSFAKGDTIRVLSLAPKDEDEEDEDEEDEEPDQWLVGETLDGSKRGTFPAGHVQAAPQKSQETSLPPTIAIPSLAEERTESAPDVKATQEEPLPQKTTPVEQEPTGEPLAPKQQQPTAKEVEAEVLSKSGVEESVPVSTSDQHPASAAMGSKSTETVSSPVERKPSLPPLAPKPGGLAARIAAFNKPQDATAPPPLPKGKPGAWKRPAPAPGAPKPVLPGTSPAQQARATPAASIAKAPPAAVSSPSPASLQSESEAQSQGSAGFSAADAQSSIKMSLKERMAALQKGDDRSTSETAALKPSAPPKPAPGKIGEDRRNVALAGMGAGSTQAASSVAAPQAPEIQVSSERQEEATKESTSDQAAEATSLNEAEKEAEVGNAAVALDEASTEGGKDTEVEGEQTEEDKESERRAAIAKRMAALGGRRMGGSPALFGAPTPPSKQKSFTESDATPPVKMQEPVSPAADEKEMAQEPIQSGKTLAVPRRTAPPRKKKSSASSNLVTEASQEDRAVADPGKQDSSVSSPNERDETISASKATAVGDVGAGGGVLIGEGIKHLTEEPGLTTTEDEEGRAELAPSDVTSDYEIGTPISEGELDENTKRLEDFVRTPREDADIRKGSLSEAGEIGGSPDEAEEEGEEAEEEEEQEQEQQGFQKTDAIISSPIRTVSSPPPANAPPPRPDSVIGRPPSARPSSARPPIPKSSMPVGGEVERTSSPAPTRALPLPASASRQNSAAVEAERTADGTNSTATEDISRQSTILAKPKPRMAVPVDLSDDEGDEETEEGVGESLGASTQEPVVQPSIAAEPEDLTEEEEDRQRRARIAARMAKMGGQPIMGAPMPLKRSSVLVTSPGAAPSHQDTLMTEKAEEQEGDEAPQAEEATEEKEAIPTILPTRAPSLRSPTRPSSNFSPPPIPTKSPPPVALSAIERRMSQISMSDDTSLARRASLLSRPPVPKSTHSRETSKGQDGEIEEDEDFVYLRDAVVTPPPLPVSPSPRAPSRAPPRHPLPIAEGDFAPPLVEEDVIPAPAGLTTEETPKRTSTLQEVAPRSARDLDLMPSSQWWRHGIPVKLPPSLLRSDANSIVSTQNIGKRHLIKVEIIFEDYSSTVIEVHFDDDDIKEEATELKQRHNPAPSRPNAEQLHYWSQKYGSQVARHAVASHSAKSNMGDGSSKGFIAALLTASAGGGNNDLLPSVGSSFGAMILAQTGTTPIDVGADEIRAGDIIALHGIDLKGKKGLASYHATFGSAHDPTYACVIESEAKKRKLRCILVAGIEGKRGKGPEEVSLRLDDVKSGLLRVFRLAPRDWLAL